MPPYAGRCQLASLQCQLTSFAQLLHLALPLAELYHLGSIVYII